MNEKQKIALVTLAGLLLFTLAFAPWKETYRNSSGHIQGTTTKIRFIFMPPQAPPAPYSSGIEVRLHTEVLCFTWIALGVAYAAAYVVLDGKHQFKFLRKQTPHSNAGERI